MFCLNDFGLNNSIVKYQIYTKTLLMGALHVYLTKKYGEYLYRISNLLIVAFYNTEFSRPTISTKVLKEPNEDWTHFFKLNRMHVRSACYFYYKDRNIEVHTAIVYFRPPSLPLTRTSMHRDIQKI